MPAHPWSTGCAGSSATSRSERWPSSMMSKSVTMPPFMTIDDVVIFFPACCPQASVVENADDTFAARIRWRLRAAECPVAGFETAWAGRAQGGIRHTLDDYFAIVFVVVFLWRQKL